MQQIDVEVMNKEDQLNFLKTLLNQKIGIYLTVLSEYRAITSMYMTMKNSDKVLTAQTQLKESKELLELQIKELKLIIKEVENEELKI